MTFVSSANRRGLVFSRHSDKSSIYDKNSNGPKIEPFGSPQSIKRSDLLGVDLNEIINKRKQGKKVPYTFLVNGVEYSDPNVIANQFCKYFSRLGPNLANKIQNVSVSSSSFLSGEFVNSLFLELATEQEVLEIVKCFKNGVARGYDNLPVFAIKESIDLIVNILTHLVNLAMSSGIFPDPLKLARVVPIFKSGDARTNNF